MIEIKNDASRNLEKALQALEQAKQRVANEKKKQKEKIPVIDKKTGQQKVDKQNRKQWKYHTADSTDWNSKENAKM